jgi:hypothetical protein
MDWLACVASHDLDQRRYQVEGQWEDDGRILLNRDLGQRLQVAQLQGGALRADHCGGLSELGRGEQFPSAWITLALFSRSASACLAMARYMIACRSRLILLLSARRP